MTQNYDSSESGKYIFCIFIIWLFLYFVDLSNFSFSIMGTMLVLLPFFKLIFYKHKKETNNQTHEYICHKNREK